MLRGRLSHHLPLRWSTSRRSGLPRQTGPVPQFAHSFPALLALGFVFCLMTLVWLTAYAVAVARAGDFLSRSWVKRAIEAVTGAVLVERVFGYPGLGNLLYDAIKLVDYFLIYGCVYLLILTIGCSMMLLELIYPLIDPRIRSNSP